MQGQGFRVLRFWNDKALKAIDKVKEMILLALEEREYKDGSGLEPTKEAASDVR